MSQVGLAKECQALERVISDLEAGKITCEILETKYSLGGIIGYYKLYLGELRELDAQIAAQGNTPELLNEVYKKYQELWLTLLYFDTEGIQPIVARLLHYPNNDDE